MTCNGTEKRKSFYLDPTVYGDEFPDLYTVAYLCMEMTPLFFQVSKPGSVEVEKLMNIERYSHVMHISSTVIVLFNLYPRGLLKKKSSNFFMQLTRGTS